MSADIDDASLEGFDEPIFDRPEVIESEAEEELKREGWRPAMGRGIAPPEDEEEEVCGMAEDEEGEEDEEEAE